MTPQFNFTVVAPIAPGQEQPLRDLLLSMNRTSGDADPGNPLFPFGQFPRLHFSRFVILDDRTSGDLAAYGLPLPFYPSSLAFLGDFDGPHPTILEEFAQHASIGLTRIFTHCDSTITADKLLEWMLAHSLKPSAVYINQVGRTMRSVREESALYDALQSYITAHDSLYSRSASEIFTELKSFVAREKNEGRLTLTPEVSTPLLWSVANLLHLIGVPLLLLLLAPLLLIYSPFLAFQLRRRETTDPEIAPRIELDYANALAHIEDRDVTNQFSAFGSIKPGLFRRWTLVFVLWIINYTARHIFNRGRLARVSTIHFARWVFLDKERKRLFFASNYDGSLEAYMDDFINKVGFGLNAVFSNGIGYPTTNWLIADGAKDEQKFKYYIRRHQVPTEVWYNPHPGVTAFALQRNALIRAGLDKDLHDASRSLSLGSTPLEGTRTMPASEIDFRDIQGIVRFGYGPLTEACFLLVRIRDAAAARRWLAGAPVTNAVKRDKVPKTALQIAFTVEGLRAIGLDEDIIAGFSNEFLSGIATDESRSRRLGDVGPNAPASWDWGSSDESTPHLVLMLYSVPGALDAWHQDIHGPHWEEAFHPGICSHTTNMHGFEPFGFKDGVSQPTLDWERTRGHLRRHHGVHQPRRPGGVPARLSQRVRALHRSTADSETARQRRLCALVPGRRPACIPRLRP